MDNEIVKVTDVMQTSLHMIDGVASVASAIAEMGRLKVSSLIISRRHEGDEYGVVTVHDIAARVVGANRSAERTSVYQIMTKPALTINADMHVKYAIRLLARLGLSRALVMRDNEVVGLVTLRDLVLGYSDGENSPSHEAPDSS